MASNKALVEGFDDLIDKLNQLGNAGNLIANKGLREGAEVIVKQQQMDAPRHPNGPANGKDAHGADKLKPTRIMTAKQSKNKYIQIGIPDTETWNYAVGVYFQHHGFYNVRTKTYVAGSLWFDKSFKKSEQAAVQKLLEHCKREVDRVL